MLYMEKNSLKTRRCPKIILNCRCEHEGYVYKNIKTYSVLLQSMPSMFIQSLHGEGQSLGGVNILTRAFNTIET